MDEKDLVEMRRLREKKDRTPEEDEQYHKLLRAFLKETLYMGSPDS